MALLSNAKLSVITTDSPGALNAALAAGASAATTEIAARILRRRKDFFMVVIDLNGVCAEERETAAEKVEKGG